MTKRAASLGLGLLCGSALVSGAAQAQSSCGPGQVVVDVAGHCCSPGQSWDASFGACMGTPTIPTCGAGQTADASGHCCDVGQAWDATLGTCTSVAAPLSPTPLSPPAPPEEAPPVRLPSCAELSGRLQQAALGADLSCACDGTSLGGAVWGTGIYTTDSSICLAAVQAGALSPVMGGAISLRIAPGCSRYEGASQNGVTSQAWDAFSSSFFFPGHGEGVCPAPAAPALARASPSAGGFRRPYTTNSFDVEVRASFGIVLGGKNVAQSLGAGLGLGEWIHQTFYVGALGYGVEQTDSFVALARLGAEVRFAFASSASEQRVNEGDWTPDGVRHWVGVAAGYESFVSLADTGPWVELEYGLDVLGALPFGFVLSAGYGADKAEPSVVASPSHDDIIFYFRVYF